MERTFFLLIFSLCILSAKEPDYIFWAKLNTKNLILNSSEFHLSRAMSINKNAKYEYICEINSNNIKDTYKALKLNKEQLLECINKAKIYDYTKSEKNIINTSTHLVVFPMYFKASVSIDGKILIFRRNDI